MCISTKIEVKLKCQEETKQAHAGLDQELEEQQAIALAMPYLAL
jgi:hypothetical protein